MSEKIEPALSRDGWRDKRHESQEYGSAAVVIQLSPAGEVAIHEWFGGPETPGDEIVLPEESVAPAIALLNAALPDSDPRKITREKLDALTTVVGAAALWSVSGHCDDKQHAEEALTAVSWLFHALESYLPPEA